MDIVTAASTGVSRIRINLSYRGGVYQWGDADVDNFRDDQLPHVPVEQCNPRTLPSDSSQAVYSPVFYTSLRRTVRHQIRFKTAVADIDVK